MRKQINDIGAVVLLFIILMKTASMPLVTIDYAINQNFIARTLCENKAKPEMHCNGKCFMKKQLARSGENQDAGTSHGNTRITLLDFNESPANFRLDMFSDRRQPVLSHSSSPLSAGSMNRLLRPPIA